MVEHISIWEHPHPIWHTQSGDWEISTCLMDKCHMGEEGMSERAAWWGYATARALLSL